MLKRCDSKHHCLCCHKAKEFLKKHWFCCVAWMAVIAIVFPMLKPVLFGG